MKIKSSSYALILLLLSFGSTLHAQWSDNVAENDTIVVGVGNQTDPVIISDGTGGVILAWKDTRFNGSDIFAGRLDKAGRLPWQIGGVPVATAQDDQKAPAIISNGRGGAYIAWQDNRAQGFDDIYAQEIDHLDGLARWQENGKLVQESSIRPNLIEDSIFGIIVASYTRALGRDLMTVQKLDRDGQPAWPSFTLPGAAASVASTSSRPKLISDFNGGAIVAWTDVRGGNGTELYAARLDQTGANSWPDGEMKLVATLTPDTQPAIVADGQSGVIIVWISPEQPGSTDDVVRAQRLNAQGQAQWASAGVVVANQSASKRNAKIARTDDGVFVVVWEDLSTGRDRDLAAQRITSSGSVQGPLIDVVSENGAQSNPVILANGRGGLIVAWEDNRDPNTQPDIYGQLIDASGGLTWGPGGLAVSLAADIQANPTLSHDGLGGAIIAWQDFRNGNDFDIYSQRVSQSGALGEFRTLTTTAPTASTSWEVGGAQLIAWDFRGEIDSVSIELSRNGGVSYLPADIITVGTPNTGSFPYVVTGAPSSNCRLRIRAVNNEHIQNLSPVFTITEAASPTLLTTAVGQAALDSALQITAVSADLSGVDEVTLFYGEGGALSFVSSAMVRSDPDEFRATIPAASISLRGLRYYISSVDSIGLKTVSDTFNVTVSFDGGVQTRLVALGNEVADFRMISAPNLLTQTALDSIFAASGFDAQDSTSWRVFQYRGASYVERDSLNALSFRFEPGEAFWLISASPRTIDFGPGISQSSNANLSITLHAGWNQIGNPFAFPIAWADILTASGDPNLSLPSTWRDSYVSPRQLEPFEGYFVHFFGNGDTTLVFPPRAFDESGSLARRSAGLDWRIQISAQCGAARDIENYAGIDQRAALEWDRLDQPEPPPFGEFVSVNFPHDRWSRFRMDYTSDYRPEIGEGQIWEFQVRTNQKNSEAVLTFSGLADVPSNIDLLLLDERLNLRQDLRLNPHYRFPSGSRGTTKALKLLAGDREFLAAATGDLGLIPENFELSQNFPNPFNPTTSIRFGLPSESRTTIRVYDLLGRRVKTILANELLQAGFHLASWDGRDDNFQPVASGVYVYRIVAGAFSQARKMVLVK